MKEVEGSVAEETSESKKFEKNESALHEKVAKRKIKKMTNSQQQIAGKALHIPPKTGKFMIPNANPSVKGY